MGAVIQALVYAFTLGAHPAAAVEADSLPVLLGALNGTATVLFAFGNVAGILGYLVTIYLGISRWRVETARV